jgi:hypothetical protein
MPAITNYSSPGHPPLAIRVLFISLFLALGLWIYSSAAYRAAGGEFPLTGDVVMPVLLVLWWWWPPSANPFDRQTSFDILGITQASTTREASPKVSNGSMLKRRFFWSIASIIGLLFLESRAAAAAHAAALEPATHSLIRYAICTWAFFAYVLLWIVGFPILDLPDEEVHLFASKKLHFLGRVILIFIASLITWYGVSRTQELLHDPKLSSLEQFHLLQALLLRAVVAIYILLIIRRFLPMIALRPALLSARGPDVKA